MYAEIYSNICLGYRWRNILSQKRLKIKFYIILAHAFHNFWIKKVRCKTNKNKKQSNYQLKTGIPVKKYIKFLV